MDKAHNRTTTWETSVIQRRPRSAVTNQPGDSTDTMKHGNLTLAPQVILKSSSFKSRSDSLFKTCIAIEVQRLVQRSRLAFPAVNQDRDSPNLLLAKSNRKWEIGLHQPQLIQMLEMILVRDLPVKFKESMKVSGALCMQILWIRVSTISWWSQRRLRALAHSGLKTLWPRTWWWGQPSRSFMHQIAAHWPLNRTHISKI